MSGYKAHFLAGLIVTALAAIIAFNLNYLAFTPANLAWLFGISFVFSLLPDADIGTSLIRKVLLTAFIVYILFSGIGIVGYILGAIVIVIQFLPHRGIMHTFVMGALLAGMLWFYFHNLAFPIIAFLNFISHLVLDRM